MKIQIYIGCISETTIFVQFYGILPDLLSTITIPKLLCQVTYDLLKSCMNNIINALNTKMEVQDTHKSKLAEIKAISRMIPLDGDNKYAASDIRKMIEFLVDNVYVGFGGELFRQTVGIALGTNCAPLLADLFLYQRVFR